MSKSSHEKLNLKSSEAVERKHKLARGGLALLLAGTILTGAGCSGDKVGAQAPEIKSSTTTESVAKPTETVENYTDQFLDDMEVYKDMSVEDFESLPREEKLIYTSFLIDQTEERGNYDIAYKSSEYEINSTEASVSNSAQEILDINYYAEQMVFLQFIESNKPSGQKDYDKIDGRKMLSSVYYDVGQAIVPNAYLERRDYIDSLDRPGKLLYSAEALESSGLLHGMDNTDGKEVQYMDINYITSDKPDAVVSARFVYCEFKDYRGDLRSTWLLESSVNENQSLDNISSIEASR